MGGLILAKYLAHIATDSPLSAVATVSSPYDPSATAAALERSSTGRMVNSFVAHGLKVYSPRRCRAAHAEYAP